MDEIIYTINSLLYPVLAEREMCCTFRLHKKYKL